MAVRHRIPIVFSIYMVDVLCCALGCVILLWQVSFQEAEKQTAEANARNQLLLQSNSELSSEKLANITLSNEIAKRDQKIDAVSKEFANLKVNLDASRKNEILVTLALEDARVALAKSEQLALVRKREYDALKNSQALAVAALESQLKDLNVKQLQLDAKSTQTAEALAEKLKSNAALLIKIAETEGKLRGLEKDLNDKQTAMTVAGKKLEDQAGKLSEVERLAQLLGREKIELLGKLKVADLRVRILETDMARSVTDTTESQKKLAALSLDRDTLKNLALISTKDLEAARAALAAAKAVAENRFAGITLTGTKVVFMVDMSGSMELIDETTPEPDKWPLVCDTVAKIMQSLPDLREFQVILFSDKVRYPLGNDGKWYSYTKKDDSITVAARLKAIKPKGETNMFVAFEETFKFRDTGMDAIYLLSDGLPNAGPGIPANSPNLTEQQQTDYLAKYIRNRLKNDWNRRIQGKNRVPINAIGYFFESPDVGAFLWALARENDGSFVGMSKP